MNLDLTAPTPLQYFAALVASDAHFPLLEAVISLAQDEYPDTDVQQVLGQVDQLQARLKRRLPQDAAALQKLRTLNQYFFNDLGFAGNVNHYYDPDNSFIPVLLRTRRGIPVSLAVLWMELAQSIGLASDGLNFPGHFLVKINLPMGQVVIDPCTGQSLSREELIERLTPYQRMSLVQEDMQVPLAMYLQAMPERQIVARMLRNLKDIYTEQEDWSRLLATQQRLIILLPDDWQEYRDRGLAYAESGDTQRAVADLQTYLDHERGALDADAIAERMSQLRRADH